MRTPTLVLTLAALALTPAGDTLAKKTHPRPPGPDRVRAVLRDCAHDSRLDRRYRITTLRRTLRHVPKDIAEYTDCEQVIKREIRRRASR